MNRRSHRGPLYVLSLIQIVVCVGLGARADSAPRTAGGPVPRRERVLPLHHLRVTTLGGQLVHQPLVGERTAHKSLRQGQSIVRLAEGDRLFTRGPDGHAELLFSDGSRLRLAADTHVTLWPTSRRIELRTGRVLLQADRMLGGLALVTEHWVVSPLGTTYLVEQTEGASATLLVSVLEGAVCMRARSMVPAQDAANESCTSDDLVLPGEQRELLPTKAGWQAHTGPLLLDQILSSEPLLSGRVFLPLPVAVHKKISGSAGEQRQGLLSRRNDRLRREVFWQRPPRQADKQAGPTPVPGPTTTVVYE